LLYFRFLVRLNTLKQMSKEIFTCNHSQYFAHKFTSKHKCNDDNTLDVHGISASTTEITLLLFFLTTNKLVMFFARIPFVLNRTFNAMPTEKLQ